MKKYLFIIMCLCVGIVSANAQQKKATTYYTQKDIDGIWLTTEVYNEHTQSWQAVGGDDASAWAFTDIKSDGRPIAILNNSGGVSQFVYTFAANSIKLYNIVDRASLLVTIKVLSVSRGQSFVGRMSTTSSPYTAKFKFVKIDTEEEKEE